VLDAISGQWLSVIDDRDGSRVGVAVGDADRRTVRGVADRIQALSAGPGVPIGLRRSRSQAITALPDGTFLMGEEGHLTRDGVWQRPFSR